MSAHDDERRRCRQDVSPTRDAACLHEWHAEVAEYRLRHDGIKPALVAYLAGIGAQPWTRRA
jgi:hypothetical protein